jgi:hypothetical protein
MHDLVSILLNFFDHPNLIGAAFLQCVEGEFGIGVVHVVGESEASFPVGDIKVGAVLEAFIVLSLHWLDLIIG